MSSAPVSQTVSIPGVQNSQYSKEHSIFVGGFVPKESNSDLLDIFRSSMINLRNDHEPGFIRQCLSRKSAKILLDLISGAPRGYGFVRYVLGGYIRLREAHHVL